MLNQLDSESIQHLSLRTPDLDDVFLALTGRPDLPRAGGPGRSSVLAVLMGFSATAGVGGWVAAVGLLALSSFALTWLGIAFGLAAKTLDAATNAPFPLILLPFVGSGIVPTHSMPIAVRYFAEYQPFTPIIETLRGLLMGTPIANNGILAVAWCVAIAVLGYLWAMRVFARDRTQ